MDEIVRIASMTPEDVDTCPSECQFDNLDNYMFFRNLVTMRHHIDTILNCDPAHVDQLLSNGHDWASDHVTVASENLTQVHDWLISETNSQ
mgnify:FL=1